MFVTAVSAAPSCADQKTALNNYLVAAFAHGNLTEAASYTTNDDSFELHWWSTTAGLEKIGFAPTYTGPQALFKFFGGVFSVVKDFHLAKSDAPPAPLPGISDAGELCGSATNGYDSVFVKEWQEISTVIKNGNQITDARNLVRYVVNADNLIREVNIFAETYKYEAAFA